MRRRSRSFDVKNVLGTVSKYSGILNMALVAVGALIAFKIYNAFFGSSPFGSASDAADKAAVKNFTTRNAAEGDALEATKANLKQAGLVVSVMHINSANTLNAMMDTTSVDEDGIINFIKAMSLQTFQLTAVAYGQRELRNYRNSHIFDPDTWNDMFSEKKMYGTLKFHLKAVLSSSEQSKLSAYISKIP